MQSILITGGCGFVGSNLSILLKAAYPLSRIIAFDNLKRRGSELNVSRLKTSGVEFIHGDIRNREDFEEIGKVDFIIEAAAEPSVLAGINNTPEYLVNTNLLGTINCLNYAVRHNAAVIFLSTSRVYPFALLDSLVYEEFATRYSFGSEQTIRGASINGITSDFPLVGARSLYGATKLASELLIIEYIEFLGLNAVINRCGVITGKWQMGKIDQGVVTLWMARHIWQKDLTYNGYNGQGKQVRDILHIHDLFRLIDYQLNHFNQLNGKTLNVGGGVNCSVSLKELTAYCEKFTGNKINIIPVAQSRKADVRIYITDNTETTQLTGWQPVYTPEKILEEIFEWITGNKQQLKPILY